MADHFYEMGDAVKTVKTGSRKIAWCTPDIVKGLFYSVIKRILEMDSLTDRVVRTGGVVAYNTYLVKMVQEIAKSELLVPERPQLTGAVGVALFAMENEG